MGTAYVYEYASTASKRPGAEDDNEGATTQIPGELIRISEKDTSSATQVLLNPDTTFFRIQAFGADIHWNMEDTEPASAGLSSTGGRNRTVINTSDYQGVIDGKTGAQRYTKVNLLDAS